MVIEENKHSVSFRLDRKLYMNFKDKCKVNKQTATQVLESLILDYLQFPDKDKQDLMIQLRKDFLAIAKDSNKVLTENLDIYLDKIKTLEKELMMKKGEVEALRRMLKDN